MFIWLRRNNRREAGHVMMITSALRAQDELRVAGFVGVLSVRNG